MMNMYTPLLVATLFSLTPAVWAANAPASEPAAITAEAMEQININQASATLIADKLTGIGQAKAEAIVAYREQHGAFKQIDELTNVKGIGQLLVDKNRARILL